MARLLQLLALCVFVAGCGGESEESTPEEPAPVNDMEDRAGEQTAETTAPDPLSEETSEELADRYFNLFEELEAEQAAEEAERALSREQRREERRRAREARQRDAEEARQRYSEEVRRQASAEAEKRAAEEAARVSVRATELPRAGRRAEERPAGRTAEIPTHSSAANAVPPPPPKELADWTVQGLTDDFGEVVVVAAQSRWAAPRHEMDFPYHDQRARINIGCSEVWFEFSTATPRLARVENRSARVYSIEARLDGAGKSEHWAASHFDDTTVGIVNYASNFNAQAVAQISRGDRLAVLFPWRTVGNAVFEWSLRGAVEEIATSCATTGKVRNER